MARPLANASLSEPMRFSLVSISLNRIESCEYPVGIDQKRLFLFSVGVHSELFASMRASSGDLPALSPSENLPGNFLPLDENDAGHTIHSNEEPHRLLPM